ncbi:MAG TPA: LamG-like jellyroll fold domain-containing protein [Polyangiaceae bacterium]|nr:LamG-like jellyroll fold domain-containing protein [Polyangiaceae bacterium]
MLTACPQLLDDEFYAGLDGRDASSGGESVLDAGALPSGPPGPGGGAKPPPGRDAGSAEDAGATPLSPVQVALRAALAHRYRFDTSAPLVDSMGGPDAVSEGAAFSAGAAVLTGGGTTGPYIDLPNGLLSGLRNASFEIWVIWDVDDPTDTTSEWQRIFDLGRNPTSVEGQQCVLNADATSLYLTPRTNGASGKLQLKCETCGETQIVAPSLAVGVQTQLVGVVDDDGNLLSLYRDGEFVASQPYPGSLATITDCTARTAPCDWNNWLGRSQHIEDPTFQGRILDFRIYSAALAAELIRASFSAGPDAD